MRLICVTWITVLALGLITASGASAKPPVLELKEAGAPVPAGAEVTVQLNYGRAAIATAQVRPATRATDRSTSD
jgi:hypothetical protein